MTVERLELRRMLSQMLADEGINQTTLKEMVGDILQEKINKAVKEVLAETSLERRVDMAISDITKSQVNSQIAEKVRKVLGCTSISISCSESTYVPAEKPTRC